MKNKSMKFYKSFRIQMLLVFYITNLTICGIIGFICLYTFREKIQKEAIISTTQVASQISTKAKIILDETNKLLLWGDSNDVHKFLNAGDERCSETMTLIKDIALYRNTAVIDNNIKNIYIMGIDGVYYSESRGIYNKEKDEKSISIFNKVLKKQNEMIYIYDDKTKEESIVIGKGIYQAATHKILGYVVVEFYAKTITGLYQNSVLGKTGKFILVDQENKSVLKSTENKNEIISGLKLPFADGSGSYIIEYHNKKTLIVYHKIPYTSWYLLGYVYINELLSDINGVLLIITGAIVAMLIISFILYYYFSKRMTFPIIRLKEKMLEAGGGNFDAIVENISNNEFSVLESQYNNMLNRIKDLVEKSRKEQVKLQMAEVKALQAQINPHFLYNTLDTVIWLIAVNKNDEAIDIIEQLSMFFKTGLSKGLDWIKVEKEVEHVRSYLYIQQKRYLDLLTYSIEVDPEINQYFMLKMTLQPIVENAIYHGIKNKVTGGNIKISGKVDKAGNLVFTIEDTGIGMEERKLQMLNDKLEKNEMPYEDNENGFGLYNVNRRIKLYYGNNYGIDIWSKEDVGTIVTITIGQRRE